MNIREEVREESSFELVTPTYTYTVTSANPTETVTITDTNVAATVVSNITGVTSDGSGSVSIESVTYNVSA
jgi:hypothetical protein